jgi:hypothetical protein
LGFYKGNEAPMNFSSCLASLSQIVHKFLFTLRGLLVVLRGEALLAKVVPKFEALKEDLLHSNVGRKRPYIVDGLGVLVTILIQGEVKP